MRMSILFLSVFIAGCATTSGRFSIGAALGGGVGAVGGAALSPNDESRPINALVFGLLGALAGGTLGILTDSQSSKEIPHPSLRSKEMSKEMSNEINQTTLRNEFEISNPKSLPPFIQERLTPVVVEEYHEPDSLSEDGSLHEPHKVYRIKRPAELISKPVSNSAGEKQK